MDAIIKRVIGSVALSLAACGAASAGPSPIGVWMDQTGRGAVEIIDCGGKLCGHIVWVKDAKHNDGCNFQIIGDVKPVGANRWDKGWIVDPERDPKRRYDVEITPVGEQKLKVVGYMGSKFFSESMTWTRAPADLKKCSEVAAKPEASPAPPAETPRREAEAAPKAPPPAAAPAPTEPEAKPAKPKTASRKSKDCKVNFGGYTFKVPCSALE
jgi:uncharacterized protein (DUF2147 family)